MKPHDWILRGILGLTLVFLLSSCRDAARPTPLQIPMTQGEGTEPAPQMIELTLQTRTQGYSLELLEVRLVEDRLETLSVLREPRGPAAMALDAVSFSVELQAPPELTIIHNIIGDPSALINPPHGIIFYPSRADLDPQFELETKIWP